MLFEVRIGQNSNNHGAAAGIYICRKVAAMLVQGFGGGGGIFGKGEEQWG